MCQGANGFSEKVWLFWRRWHMLLLFVVADDLEGEAYISISAVLVYEFMLVHKTNLAKPSLAQSAS